MRIDKFPICFSCKHYIHFKKGIGCDAFDNIPNEILIGDNDHSKPLKDQDNNIVFEKI